MATSGHMRLKGALECPLCLETFKDPITLDCGHSYCRKCLVDYIVAHPTAVARTILPCSVCRHEMKVPDPDQPMDQWRKQLMPSYTIKKLVEDVLQPAEADSCDENCFASKSIGKTTLSVMWCSDCEVSFCQSSAEQHRAVPFTKDHHLDKLVREVQNSEDNTEICKTHEFCQSGSLFPQIDRVGRLEKYPVDLDYSRDLESNTQMLSEFGKVKMSFEDVSQETCATVASVSLSRPLLTEQITAQTPSDAGRPGLGDLIVVTVRDIVAVIVTDWKNRNVKCFYRSTSPSTTPRTSHSTCMIDGPVHGITNLKDNRVMVSVIGKNQLVTLHVTPDLVKEKITSTQQMYISLAMMDNGHLVASTCLSGSASIDVLDVRGNTARVIRTLPSVFVYPRYLTLTRQDRNIVVSDYRKRRVICMTSEGDIVWTYSPPEGTSFQPRGVTTNREDDVIVADQASHQVIVLTRSGKHKTDLLTPADTEITEPNIVHYDDQGHLYVTDKDRILVYKV